MSTNELTSPPETSATGFSEGQTLAGCYALLRNLTVGSGPQVWLANDEVLGKDVTLHFLPPAVIKDSAAMQELRQEITRVRKLIHPQILRIYDLVEEPEWAAISMNAFEGESLAARLGGQADRRLAAASIEAWAYPLVQTIEDAHRIQFLHRDLAPENLLLMAGEKMLVANFGVSRTIQDALGRAGQGDEARVAYVSPQTLAGNAPARTDDIYSLGAVLYTILVGTPPFAGGDLRAKVPAGVTAETISALEKGELQIPEAWRKAIAASLQKSPEGRPQTAAEFLKIMKGEASAPVAVPAAPQAPAVPVAEKPAVVVPVPAELPPAKPEPVAKTETPVPPVPVEAKAPVEKPAPPVVKEVPVPRVEKVETPREATPVEMFEALGPDPEVEIEESKARDEIAKGKTTPPEPVAAAAPVPAPSVSPIPRPVEPEPKKPQTRPGLTDFKPRLYPEESRFPIVAVGIIAVLILFAIIWHLSNSGKKSDAQNETGPTPVPEPTEVHSQTSPAPSSPTVVAPSNRGELPKVAATPPPELQKAVADAQAALDKAKETADAAEQARAGRVKEQQAAESAVTETQNAVKEKTQAADTLKSATNDLAAQRKKLEDSQKAADAAAADAQKVAAEKTRLAEEGKKTLADFEKQSSEKTAAQEKAASEMDALQKTLTEQKQMAVDAAKAATEAATAHDQQMAALTKEQQGLQSAQSALDAWTAKAKTAEKSTGPTVSMAGSTPAPATPGPTPVKPTTPEPTKLAKLTTPAASSPAPATPGTATTSGPSNSLGMKFAPVGDVDFCIWLVRVKDFEAFAKEVNLKSTSWREPGFRQSSDHPVVNVTWVEAVAFCKWLTDKEHKSGTLPANQFYRLPTDLEWSKAVGLPDESGKKTPEDRDMGIPEVYPWGTGWPPPPGAGNYTGEETGSDVAIKGYDDGFAWTSPVGSFKANKYGLYDMGGNVWQWCMDTWNTESKAKVLRGASWYNGALKLSLLSSCRVHAAPDSSTDNYGFRIVRATEAPAAVKGKFR